MPETRATGLSSSGIAMHPFEIVTYFQGHMGPTGMTEDAIGRQPQYGTDTLVDQGCDIACLAPRRQAASGLSSTAAVTGSRLGVVGDVSVQ